MASFYDVKTEFIHASKRLVLIIKELLTLKDFHIYYGDLRFNNYLSLALFYLSVTIPIVILLIVFSPAWLTYITYKWVKERPDRLMERLKGKI